MNLFTDPRDGKHPVAPKKEKPVVNVLAIDQASNCGWCTRNAYGVWDFNTRKDESSGMKILRFRSKLKEIVELENINLIVYERAASQYATSVIHSAKMIAMIETFCEENGLNYKCISAKELKQFATGKGNAGKPQMIEAAKRKYGYEGDNDNEADAIHMYHHTIADLNL